MLKLSNKNSGFTIVELLIVIVVIAILATISVVAYTGIQDRAYNVSAAQFVKNFEQALRLYALEHGDFPPHASWWPCLGKGDTDINGDGIYDCGYLGTTIEQQGNADFNNEIRPYINPDIKPPAFTITTPSGKKETGANIWYTSGGTVDGQPNRWFIYYVIKGKGVCPYGNIVIDASSGWPNFSSTSRGYSYEQTNGRGCLMTLNP